MLGRLLRLSNGLIEERSSVCLVNLFRLTVYNLVFSVYFEVQKHFSMCAQSVF